jgi:hypothetical protein
VPHENKIHNPLQENSLNIFEHLEGRFLRVFIHPQGQNQTGEMVLIFLCLFVCLCLAVCSVAADNEAEADEEAEEALSQAVCICICM